MRVTHSRRTHSRSAVLSTGAAVLLSAAGLCAQAHRQETVAPAQARDGGPVISRVTPAAATPGTALEIEGYRMGVNLENHEREKVRVVFAQGGKLLAATHGGGSWMTADVQGALQSMTVIVPEGLEADACHVRVEVGELRSAPASIEIKSELIPAVLTNLRPRQIRPGAVLWVYGTNFTTADEAELTDARGKTRRIAAGSPDGTVTAFTLPKDTPEGEVTVNIIQPQGDASVRSNSLRVLVTEGPAPLDIHGDSLMPVAPGQWLDLVVTTFEPLEKADRLEVSFRQGGQTLVVAAENLKHPRVRVPDGLAPGDAEIQTRTWSGESFSTWAEPVTLRLLERPAPPHLYSVEIVPSRVDLEFRQEGRLIEVTRFDVETHPRLRVPERIASGAFEVRTRTWRGGRRSRWSEVKRFILSEDSAGREVETGPIMGVVPLGPETPKTTRVYPGEHLIIRGEFPVASVDKLQIVLEQPGRTVTLTPAAHAQPGALRVTLPDHLTAGMWHAEVRIPENNAATKIPTALRIE